jgi:hypothetical protein
MLLEAIAKFFLGIFEAVLSLLPPVSVQLPTGSIGALGNIISGVAYFLPIGLIVTLIMISLSIDMIILIWRIILRIKSFVPTWGN